MPGDSVCCDNDELFQNVYKARTIKKECINNDSKEYIFKGYDLLIIRS